MAETLSEGVPIGVVKAIVVAMAGRVATAITANENLGMVEAVNDGLPPAEMSKCLALWERRPKVICT